MHRSTRLGQAVLVLFGVLCAVISGSVYAAPDPFPADANALIATFGIAFGALVVVLAALGLSSGHPWAWQALWILPVFFVSHVLLLGTLLPDGAFLLLSVAALALSRPRAAVYQSVAPSTSSMSVS